MGQPGPAGLPCLDTPTVPSTALGCDVTNRRRGGHRPLAGLLRLGRPYLGAALEARQNLVHDAVLLGFLSRKVLVPLDVQPHLIRHIAELFSRESRTIGRADLLAQLAEIEAASPIEK